VRVCVWTSRKERLCNACMMERHRDTTSECDDTADSDSDDRGSTSSRRDGDRSPATSTAVTDNTLEERDLMLSGDDSLASACDSVGDKTASVSAAVNAEDVGTVVNGADATMTSQPAAAEGGTAWSVRGTAFSALNWVSGVVSRGLVRPPVDQGTSDHSVPAVGDGLGINASAPENVDVDAQLMASDTSCTEPGLDCSPVTDSANQSSENPVIDGSAGGLCDAGAIPTTNQRSASPMIDGTVGGLNDTGARLTATQEEEAEGTSIYGNSTVDSSRDSTTILAGLNPQKSDADRRCLPDCCFFNVSLVLFNFQMSDCVVPRLQWIEFYEHVA